ncbi:hypothetical protein AiwAL_04680 [Acidiphilium sp. AL]|uniref:Uncharacterized protein n=1 Tax=Acidiphilium iwatense TaxID=768198 RepID=A0ABS9DRC5_9PROT|nr:MULTISPECIES: hypothetical protein [Acidiphilium]MCF3945306.1 hypothetical protein [Acidiphilium iwatense]MCU4159399.1 hypothetical protein [Acidiphilium sp. AL]
MTETGFAREIHLAPHGFASVPAYRRGKIGTLSPILHATGTGLSRSFIEPGISLTHRRNRMG